MTYFTPRSNFVTWAFIWKSVTMMDSLGIIAAFDLEVDWYSKVNE